MQLLFYFPWTTNLQTLVYSEIAIYTLKDGIELGPSLHTNWIHLLKREPKAIPFASGQLSFSKHY